MYYPVSGSYISVSSFPPSTRGTLDSVSPALGAWQGEEKGSREDSWGRNVLKAAVASTKMRDLINMLRLLHKRDAKCLIVVVR